MANFFIATAIYPDGHSETFEGRLWFLGGIKDEEGHALTALTEGKVSRWRNRRSAHLL